MTDAVLQNAVAYAAQVLGIVAAGGLATAMLRIDGPAARYVFWRVLLVLCLALPWLQGRQEMRESGTAVVATQSMSLGSSVIVQADAETAPASVGLNVAVIVCAVLAGGAVTRLLLLGIGLRRLRRLRRAGTDAPLTDDETALRDTLCARADIREVASVAQPVTFGLFNPVVLIPCDLRVQDPHLRRAVLAHELFHARRGDWGWLVLEEIVRATFWFHPAVWWLISRIQLAREEVVDDLTVRLTGSRRTYIEALMLFADSPLPVAAPAFGRPRHLFRRIRLISKERVMSTRRVVLSFVAVTSVVAVTSWSATSLFPLAASPQQEQYASAPGPLEVAARPVTPENPIPRRTHSVAAQYPRDAVEARAAAKVTLQVTVDQFGRISEVRPAALSVDSPDENVTVAITAAPFPSLAILEPTSPTRRAVAEAFLSAATEAVSQWQYEPPAEAPLSFRVEVLFERGAEGRVFAQSHTPAVTPSAIRLMQLEALASQPVGRGRSGGATAAPPPPPPPPPPPGNVADITTTAGVVAVSAPGSLQEPRPPVRVGGRITAPKKTKHVDPVYPPAAIADGVQGVVIIEAVISTEGLVTGAKVLRPIEPLNQAAVDAVKQWEYTPTLLNGEPVSIIMSVVVEFVLPKPAKD